MKRSLKRAKTWKEELGDLWKEDQFRYVIVQELLKGKGVEYWGRLADGPTSARTKLVLERSYTNKSDKNKSTGKEVDIVSINSDRRGKNKGTFRNPLAIEVKAKEKLGIKKMRDEIKRVRSFLSKNRGERYYEIGVVINGNTITKEHELMKSLTKNPTGNNLLVCWLDENENPVLMWEKRPKPSKKKSKLGGKSNNNRIKRSIPIGQKSNPYPTKTAAMNGRKTGKVWFRKYGKTLEWIKKQ